MTIRIAMWSGPRNISTAMMRSFENRPDTCVVDEPFYSYYLSKSGVQHPGTDEVLASQSTDWEEVARQVSKGAVADSIYYQKHMTHHMLKEVDLAWTRDLIHCFLIRDPLYVVNSYVKQRPEVNADDIGTLRQLELFDQITAMTGQDIPIVDSKEILLNPRSALQCLCDRLGIPFTVEMLNWPAGPRKSDGVWAKYWYQAVEASTGFEKYQEKVVDISDQQRLIAEASRAAYQAMFERRLKV
jgi:hypothetical protein